MFVAIQTLANSQDEFIGETIVISVQSADESIDSMKVINFYDANASSVIDIENDRKAKLTPQADVLDHSPGVVVTSSNAGSSSEGSISIRGSNVSLTARNRGTKIYQDGMLINFGGAGAPQNLIDISSSKAAEVFRGSHANLLAAGASGGAVVYHSYTGRDIDAPIIRVEQGSFSHNKTQVATGGQYGDLDFFTSINRFETDGQREQEAESQVQLSANVGYQINDDLVNRSYLMVSHADSENAGVVSRSDWNDNPYYVDPIALALDQRKQDKSLFFRNKLSWNIDAVSHFDFGVAFSKGEVTGMPGRNAGIIEDDIQAITVSPKYTNVLQLGDHTHWLTVGLFINNQSYELNSWNFSQPPGGVTPVDYSLYDGYTKLSKATEGELTLNDWDFYIQDKWQLDDVWQVTAGLQFNNYIRRFDDTCSSCSGPSTRPGETLSYNPPYDYSLDKSQWNYQMALSHFLSDSQHLFMSYSTSSTFPSLFEFEQMTGWENPEVMEIQNSKTLEFGYKFEQVRLSGESIVYYTEIDNEYMLESISVDLTRQVLTEVGATIHSGLELAINYQWLLDKLSTRLVYNYMDFHFDDHSLYGNNRLARAPKNVGTFIIHWQAFPDFDVTSEIIYTGDKTATYDLSGGDLYKINSYWLTNLSLSYQVTPSFNVFAEGKNLLDEEYIAAGGAFSTGSSPVGDRVTTGIQRSFYLGVEYRF